MKGIASVMTTVVFVVAAGQSGAAFHDGPHVSQDGEVFSAGKNGIVKIGLDVVIGDVQVKRGKYAVEHEVHGDAHILVLTGVEAKNREASAHRIPMRWIPSSERVKRTTLFAERVPKKRFRVTVVQIGGEGGDHIPESAGGV